MRTTVVMPVERFDVLLRRCLPWLPEREILRRGIINHGENDDANVEISCDHEEAEKLLDLARKIQPGSVPSIDERIRQEIWSSAKNP